jgi:hypothetical protein
MAMTRPLLIALVVALAACAGLGLWLRAERAEHRATQAEMTRLHDALAAKDAALTEVRRDYDLQQSVLARRDRQLYDLNAALADTAAAIEGATNEASDCNLDAPLPQSLVRPLRLLHSKAGARAGPAGDKAGPAAVPVPAPPDAADAGRSADNAQAGAVGGPSGGLGRKDVGRP